MKERLVQYIDYKGLSVRKFCIEVGISHNLIGNNSALGSDKLVKIWDKYPELNMDWVLTGRGEMLFEVKQSPEMEQKRTDVLQEAHAKYGKEFLKEYEALKEEHEVVKKKVDRLQDKLIGCMEERDQLRLEHQYK